MSLKLGFKKQDEKFLWVKNGVAAKGFALRANIGQARGKSICPLIGMSKIIQEMENAFYGKVPDGIATNHMVPNVQSIENGRFWIR